MKSELSLTNKKIETLRLKRKHGERLLKILDDS